MRPFPAVRRFFKRPPAAWAVALCLGSLFSVGSLSAWAATPKYVTQEEARWWHLQAVLQYLTLSSEADRNTPLVLGVLGEPPFGSTLSNSFVAKRIQNRPVAIRSCSSPESATNCHVLYIGYRDRRQVEAALEALRDEPVWTVGELRDFTNYGGIMNFIFEGELIFEYSRTAYLRWRERSQLEVDDRYLRQCGKKVR